MGDSSFRTPLHDVPNVVHETHVHGAIPIGCGKIHLSIIIVSGDALQIKFLSKSDHIAKSSVKRTLKQYTIYTAVFSVAERGCQTAKRPVFRRAVVCAFDPKSVSG